MLVGEVMIEDIQLKSINELVEDKQYFIPSYQRGYRWGKNQVQNLLNDLEEFMKEFNQKEDMFYCLQPLVIRKYEEGYEVIDGQQRLTTIALIHAYLEEESFSITYATRPDSAEFIQNIAKNYNEDTSIKNIDYHFFKEAYTVIKEWFEQKRQNGRTFKSKFSIMLGEQVKVIWYEVGEDVEVREVFSRLNSGKIELTNSELLKAALILKTSFYERPMISTQWDEIEHRLQNERFWRFLGKKKNYINRIGFLFDIAANHASSHSPDPYYTFYKLQEQDIQAVWRQIIADFALLEEWYEDRECYHLLGYLTQYKNITEYINLYRSSSIDDKQHFKLVLKQRISKEIESIHLRELDYYHDKAEIRKVLLLFNILTVLKQKNVDAYFPFEYYLESKWSLEHIHAQSTEGLNTKEQWSVWIEGTINLLEGLDRYKTLVEYLRTVSLEELTEEKFNGISQRVMEETKGEFLSESNGLDNLVLLDQGTNSSLSNHFYPVKYKRLIDYDKSGAYIPLATRNTFMKYYSDKVTQYELWSFEDGEAYVRAIESEFSDLILQAKGVVQL
ncbi:DUF262 domain-containing protein [Bacillus cereus group sp. BY105LC]|uniref:DUF262 domain-containing protein n=1 Tax=Bacillus cereus group sp. BY105LC TaxID=3018088 RepID=UPI0022E8A12A|nr:DUF262 domain-containing protein [Bacillus cereus group sp. BY105LC]